MTVAVSLALRLFHTRLLWGVPCSDVRLDEVEMDLLLGLVLGAVRCVGPWDEDDPCLRSWDGSCGGGGNCGWSGLVDHSTQCVSKSSLWEKWWTMEVV